MEWERVRSYSGIISLISLFLCLSFGHIYDPNSPSIALAFLTVSFLALAIGMSIIWFFRRKSRLYEQVSIAIKELGMEVEHRTSYWDMAKRADFILIGTVGGVLLSIDSYYKPPEVGTTLGLGGNNTYGIGAWKDKDAIAEYKASGEEYGSMPPPLAEISILGEREGAVGSPYLHQKMMIGKSGVAGFDQTFGLRLYAKGGEEAVKESFAEYLVQHEEALGGKVLELHAGGLLIRPIGNVEYYLKEADDIVEKAGQALELYAAYSGAHGASAVARVRKADLFEIYDEIIYIVVIMAALFFYAAWHRPDAVLFPFKVVAEGIKLLLGL